VRDIEAGSFQRTVAVAALLIVDRLALVQVPAVLTQLGSHETLFGILDGQPDAADLVLRPFVIDHVVRRKLVDRQETRPGNELAFTATGDENADGQRGEVVSGQEALAGQVAVGVEV